jgi:glycosyltransferase involved in cell wall biosynthesis
MGRISVIIPTYNRANLLTESIKSIQTQSHAVHEIIVVDDGSTDGTRAAVSRLSGSIRYVYQTNSGKAAALNNGLSHCSGDYIWICDDDDLALPGAAAALVTALETNSTAGFAFGRFKRFCIDPETGRRQLFEPVYWPDLDSNSLLVNLLEDCFIFQNACLVRRKGFDSVGPFREDLMRSQDYEMTIRLARQFNAIYVPEVVFLQRAHAGLRGSELDRFGSNQQMAKWLHYDAIFFRELYTKIPLSDFVPKVMLGSNAKIARRSALLQRACVFWRRKLFELSLSDMGEAIRIGEAGKLASTEELICGRFLHQKFGCDELLTTPEIANTLSSLADESGFGLSVVRAVSAPLLWYVRDAFTHGRWRKGWHFATLLLRFHGCFGTATLIRLSLRRRLRLAKEYALQRTLRIVEKTARVYRWKSFSPR